MPYAVKTDISKIWGDEFLNDLIAEDVADIDVAITGAIDDASAEIDGYLSARYALPLSSTPRVLKRPCVDIAVYVLANAHTRLTDTIEDRYNAAIKFLGLIGTGKAGLGVDEPSAQIEGSATATTSGADFTARPRRFGRGRS